MTKLEKILYEKHIYHARSVQRIGLDGFSRQCGISRTTLADHIKGRRRMGDKSLKKIAAYFGVPVTNLID